MSEEQDKLKVSLEAPKLFGRKKKKSSPPTKPPAGRAEADPPKEDAETADEPTADEPTAVISTTEDDTDETDATVVMEEPVVAATTAATTEPEAKTAAEPATKAEPAAVATDEPPASEPGLSAARKAGAVAARAARAAKAAVAKPAAPTHDDDAPLLTVYRAAGLTGLVVGAALVTLTWLALRGCEAVRGTASCGGGPGLLLLLATFGVCVYLGSALLRTFLIPDPGSSSFLAVGLVAVIALLFLVNVLDHWSMIIVIPLLSIASYLASVWVTKTFVEPADG